MHWIFQEIPHTSSAFCPVAQSEGHHPCNRPTHTRRASLSLNSSAYAETMFYSLCKMRGFVNETWQTRNPDNKRCGIKLQKRCQMEPVAKKQIKSI